MKISDTMQDALNGQIKEELSSSFIYLALAAYFESQDLSGFAKRMVKQSGEEQSHAMKIYEYLFERSGRAVIPAIPQPPLEWKSPIDALHATVGYEQHVTACINALVAKARKEEDFATEGFLMWFVKEQVEEEQSALAAVRKLELLSNAPSGVFLLDKEFGTQQPAS